MIWIQTDRCCTCVGCTLYGIYSSKSLQTVKFPCRRHHLGFWI